MVETLQKCNLHAEYQETQIGMIVENLGKNFRNTQTPCWPIAHNSSASSVDDVFHQRSTLPMH